MWCSLKKIAMMWEHVAYRSMKPADIILAGPNLCPLSEMSVRVNRIC